MQWLTIEYLALVLEMTVGTDDEDNVYDAQWAGEDELDPY